MIRKINKVSTYCVLTLTFLLACVHIHIISIDGGAMAFGYLLLFYTAPLYICGILAFIELWNKNITGISSLILAITIVFILLFNII